MNPFTIGELVLTKGKHPWSGPKNGYGIVSITKTNSGNNGVSREGKTLGDDPTRGHWIPQCFESICHLEGIGKK